MVADSNGTPAVDNQHTLYQPELQEKGRGPAVEEQLKCTLSSIRLSHALHVQNAAGERGAGGFRHGLGGGGVTPPQPPT